MALRDKVITSLVSPLVQRQIRENVLGSNMGVIITPFMIDAAAEIALSGTNADGRTMVQISVSSGSLMVSSASPPVVDESLLALEPAHANYPGPIQFPLRQGQTLFGLAGSVPVSGVVAEW